MSPSFYGYMITYVELLVRYVDLMKTRVFEICLAVPEKDLSLIAVWRGQKLNSLYKFFGFYYFCRFID